jgi:hypothetical protein
MGNRAITYFWDGREYSPGVYTHWNSGRIFFYLKFAKLRMYDATASAARFVAECCKRMPGNLLVYVFGPPSPQVAHALSMLRGNPENETFADIVFNSSPGDNGIYLVDVSGSEDENKITVMQISDYFENRKTRKDFTELRGPGDTHYTSPVCKILGTLPALPDLGGNPPPTIRRTPVKSQVIEAFAVTPKKNLLVEFKNGNVYRYYNVDKYTVRHFMEAPSKGEYFNKHIKGEFAFKQVKKIPRSFINLQK